jgi:ATP-dependent protease HslVU (ClpYQ) peptidase subunit
MSVVVWDGTTLAADSYGNNGETCFPVTKLWKDDADNLYGAVGGVQAINLLQEWSKYQGRSNYPEEARLNKATLLVIKKDKYVIRYYGSPVPIQSPLKSVLAIGEGSQYAYGALDMGATAEQAVAVAIKRSVHCNGEPVSITWSE